MYRKPELEEIKTLLHASGIRYKSGGKYLQIKCPYHDDRNPSAVVYKDNGYFKCFSCLTEKPFARLYKDLTGSEWDGKLALSLNMFGDRDVAKKVKRKKDAEKLFNAGEGVLIEGELSEVRDVPEAAAYCESRGVEESFVRAFNIKALASGKVNGAIWRDRLLIPFEDGGRVRSVEGRDYTRRQPKKVLYPAGTSVDFMFNSDGLDTEKTLIVTEGVMDVHKIWQRITRNVTCSFGVNLRDRQKETLKKFNDIILFIDDDEAGRRSVKLFEEFYPRDFRVAVIGGKDPGDGTEEEIRDAVENSRVFNEFLMADVGLFARKKRPSLS